MSGERPPLASRIVAFQNRVVGRFQHRGARTAAGERGTAGDFGDFAGARQCLLVTFKRSGEPVPTPVNFGLEDGKLYFRSDPHSAKVKRLRRDPSVRLYPCTFRGKPLGAAVDGTARILPPAEEQRAYSIIDSNYRLDMRLLERGYDGIGVPEVYVEVTPARPG